MAIVWRRGSLGHGMLNVPQGQRDLLRNITGPSDMLWKVSHSLHMLNIPTASDHAPLSLVAYPTVLLEAQHVCFGNL